MNLKSLFIVGIGGLSISISSCQKEEVYSCNPEANQWVKDHLDDVRNMTRAEWGTLEPVIGRACYVAFTPQQKLRFWDLKLEQALSLDWTDEEKAHITKLRQFIVANPSIFEPEKLYTDELYDRFDRFMYEWGEYAQEQLGWEKQTIGAIAASGYDLESKTGIVNYSIPPATGDTEKIEDCDCNLDHDFCGTMGSAFECKDHPCEDSPHGCGWVLVQKCNGVCWFE